jgi:hypothetical protein
MVHPMVVTLDSNPLNEIENRHTDGGFGTINEDISYGRIRKEPEDNHIFDRFTHVESPRTNICTHGKDPGIISTQASATSSLVHMMIHRGAYDN